jgi:hypothetical protein
MAAKILASLALPVTLLAVPLLAGCANHPVDCAVGFYHADCLPGTPGYADPNRIASLQLMTDSANRMD